MKKVLYILENKNKIKIINSFYNWNVKSGKPFITRLSGYISTEEFGFFLVCVRIV